MTQKFFRFKIENIVVINKIVTIHYYEFKKNYKFAGESHDFWEMVYVDNESVLVTRDNETLELRAGEAVFHAPFEFHAISSNGVTAPNVFVITFECKSEAMRLLQNSVVRIADRFRYVINNLLNESFHTFNISKFNPELKKLELLPEPNLGGQQLIRIHLEQLLVYIIRDLEQKNDFKLVTPPSTLEKKITDFLKRHLGENLTLEEICAEFCYSKAFLCAKFKSETHLTIMNFFIGLKVEEAKKLLREDNYNVAQISDKLGFSSPTYFIKTFKRVTHFTPLQYKNSIQK